MPVERAKTFIDSLSNTKKAIAAAVAIGGAVLTVWIGLHAEFVSREIYARDAIEQSEEIAGIQSQYYEMKEDTVARRIFELRQTGERRPLTHFEKQELDRLLREQENTKKRLDDLLRKGTK